MSKRCPHCDGEIMPSVVKCRHCGRNVKEAPEGAPSAAPGIGFSPEQGAAAPQTPSPAGAETEAAKGATEDPPPPVGVAFTPAVGPVAPAADPAQPTATTASPPGSPATVEGPGEPVQVQDWGPPSAEAAKLGPYWQVKTAPAPPAPGIPPVHGTAPVPGMPPAQSMPGNPPKGSAGMLGNIAILLAFVGGAVAAYASMQAWVVLEVSRIGGVEDVTEPIKGTLGWEGKLTLALGVISVVSALLAYFRRDAGPLKGMIVPGIGILAVVGYTLSTLTTQFTDGLTAGLMIKGMSEEAARGQVATWLDAGAITLTTQSFLYLLAGAGSVVLVGAILAFVARKPAAGATRGF